MPGGLGESFCRGCPSQKEDVGSSQKPMCFLLPSVGKTTIKKEICKHHRAVSDRKSGGLQEVGMSMELTENASLLSDTRCENFAMFRFLSNEPRPFYLAMARRVFSPVFFLGPFSIRKWFTSRKMAIKLDCTCDYMRVFPSIYFLSDLIISDDLEHWVFALGEVLKLLNLNLASFSTREAMSNITYCGSG